MVRNAPTLLLSLLLLAAAGAFAQTPNTVHLDELTWTELHDRIAAGTTTIIVPIGGTEQNGPAMTLGKHNIRVKLLSEKIARALDSALVAPVLAYVPEGDVDPPTAHMRFAGTITVPEAVFEKTLEYAARSFKRHGFRDVVLLGDHGGYLKNLRSVSDRLNREWSTTAVRVHAVPEYYRAADTEFARVLKARGYRIDEIGTHAGLADTSLMLALDARTVRTDHLHAEAKPGRAEGMAGDPRRASAELGQLGVDVIVAQSVAAIRKATARR